MKKMLWGGRFGSGPAERTLEFNSAENAELDEKLIPYDILGSIAHVRMLARQKILSPEEEDEIVSALKETYANWEAGGFHLKKELEDVHMNVEAAVTAITAAGKKMHTARSRNDQVLLDMRLYMRDQVGGLVQGIEALQDAFSSLSKKDGPMAAYTHTRVAQPITISFWCESWAEGLGRDTGRLLDLYERLDQNPLGACAIAGTSWAIDRGETARLLGFASVQRNELDTISSRGECEAELLSCLSILNCRLSRLAEELIWLSQKGLVTISEEHTTGSSIMPNKKNPDVLELIRGRAGRVYSNLVHCLVVLKGLPSGYHSDMQETKYAVMSGLEHSLAGLGAMRMVVSGLGFDQTEIEAELRRGYAEATEIADYLAMQGVPFREAHERTGRLVRHAEGKKKALSEIPEAEAGKILGVDLRGKWPGLVSLGRPRLKRKVAPARSGIVLRLEKAKKAFDALLG